MKPYLFVVFSQNLEAVKDFYQNAGFTFESGQHGEGPSHYSCTAGETVFELYPCVEGQAPSHNRMGFQFGDGDNLSDEVKDHIRSVAEESHQFDNGMSYCVLQDPEGRKLELLFS